MKTSYGLLLVSCGLVLFSGCGGGSSDVSNGLYINAALGATLVQSPIATGLTPEGSVQATVSVTRNNVQGKQVLATLTVNGVEIPQQTALGAFLGYDLSKVTIPDANPGGTLAFHASFETYSADLTLQCPSAVTITAPADNSQAAAGDSVTVTWSGAIEYATSIKPDILVRGFEPTSGKRSSLGFADRAEDGKASDTFALPELQGAPQWLVDLFVPGDLVNGEAGAGFCMLDRRIHVGAK